MTIPDGEAVFLDTHILIAGTDVTRTAHAKAQELFTVLPKRNCQLVISGQILREYLVVATRPIEANGLGMSTSDALANAEAFHQACDFCDKTEVVSHELRRLLSRTGVNGKRIHDANVVATLIANNIRYLITDNIADFEDFSQIVTLNLNSTLN